MPLPAAEESTSLVLATQAGDREAFGELYRRFARAVHGVLLAFVTLARHRDVLTLLMLVHRGAAGRERLAARAAELWPPPSGVSVQEILQGDSDALWRWQSTLPLPPVKHWWWYWRDALPRWLSSEPR